MSDQCGNPWVDGLATVLVPARIMTGVIICILVVVLIAVVILHHLIPGLRPTTSETAAPTRRGLELPPRDPRSLHAGRDGATISSQNLGRHTRQLVGIQDAESRGDPRTVRDEGHGHEGFFVEAQEDSRFAVDR